MLSIVIRGLIVGPFVTCKLYIEPLLPIQIISFLLCINHEPKDIFSSYLSSSLFMGH